MGRPLPGLLCLGLALALCCGCAGHSSGRATRAPDVVSPFPQAGMGGGDAVFIPQGELSAEETIRAYFDQQYQGYADLRYIDISAIADAGQAPMAGALAWTRALIQRRRLLRDHGLCYVETQRYPYTITFLRESDLDDPRISAWTQEGLLPGEGEQLFHLVITGLPGRAYPPIFALNAQHTLFLKKADGVWCIVRHYFPGSERRFDQGAAVPLPSEDRMLAALRAEFDAAPDADPRGPSTGEKPYSGALAASYARQYAEHPNPLFYQIGDWMGNCTNFTSQCIWYGFGGGAIPDAEAMECMTPRWHGSLGGGTPPWENVGHFWDYATGDGGLRVRVLPGAAFLQPGDIVQVYAGGALPVDRQEGAPEESRFHHSLVVVDADTLLLAQNSPNCFVYYADLVALQVRMLRPEALDGEQ